MPTTVPITKGQPYQRFTLNITPTGEEDPIEHTFTLAWNTRASFLTLDIDREETRLISGVALKVGVDLFAPYPDLKLGELYVVDLTNTGLELSYNNVGDETVVVRYEDGE